jgi:hypothetical protein
MGSKKEGKGGMGVDESTSTSGNWERVYLVACPSYNSCSPNGVPIGKLFFTGQNMRRFTERTQSYYPEKISIVDEMLQPVALRYQLLEAICTWKLKKDTQIQEIPDGFYKIEPELLTAIGLYKDRLKLDGGVVTIFTNTVGMITKLCRQQTGTKIPINELYNKLAAIGYSANIIALEAVLHSSAYLLEDGYVADMDWMISKNGVYDSYISQILSSWRPESGPLRFTTVLNGAREWFVNSEKFQGVGKAAIDKMIPHKVERQKRLLALLTSRLGSPTETSGKGKKGLYWAEK